MCERKETLENIFQKGNIIQPLAIRWIKEAGHAETFSRFVGEQITGRVLGRLTGTGKDYSSRLERAKAENEFDVILQHDIVLPNMATTWIKETDNSEAFAESIAQQVKAEILNKLAEKPAHNYFLNTEIAAEEEAKVN